MSQVLITGGSGLIGQNLGRSLQQSGHEVSILSRKSSPGSSIPSHYWDVEGQEISKELVNSCEYIVHLAGANIGQGRWTPARKRVIVESRIKSAQLIFDALDPKNNRLKAFISSSAIGYYGARTSDRIFTESDPPADDFLGQTCSEWEQAADQFADAGIRTVKIRTGIVLSKQGGALSRLQRPVRWGLGAPLGDGKQYMPWIHMDDLCAIFVHAMENENMVGAYNAVAPEHITNRELTSRLAQQLKKPLWLPNIPAFGMKLLFGEMAAMLLKGSRISSEKIRNTGFSFQFPDIDSALQELYS
jgi:uncharacterized protein (TIGR01777 family)